MWVIGCLALVGIALGIYGMLFNFTDSKGNSEKAKYDHDIKCFKWWMWALVGLPICGAILSATGSGDGGVVFGLLFCFAGIAGLIALIVFLVKVKMSDKILKEEQKEREWLVEKVVQEMCAKKVIKLQGFIKRCEGTRASEDIKNGLERVDVHDIEQLEALVKRMLAEDEKLKR